MRAEIPNFNKLFYTNNFYNVFFADLKISQAKKITKDLSIGYSLDYIIVNDKQIYNETKNKFIYKLNATKKLRNNNFFSMDIILSNDYYYSEKSLH